MWIYDSLGKSTTSPISLHLFHQSLLFSVAERDVVFISVKRDYGFAFSPELCLSQWNEVSYPLSAPSVSRHEVLSVLKSDARLPSLAPSSAAQILRRGSLSTPSGAVSESFALNRWERQLWEDKARHKEIGATSKLRSGQHAVPVMPANNITGG